MTEMFEAGFWDFVPPQRPTLRRDPLPETYTFRLRIDLKHARPPIWRRIEIRSDVNLLTLHNVIQAAFGWFNYHLYRFSLGAGPFDWSSELFLCDYDAEEGDEEGTHVSAVRLDETLQEPGDVLQYLYDYGDSWLLAIKLESARPAEPDDPTARCVGGRRAAPPEDCGGYVDEAMLASVLPDPALFELDVTNEAIEAWLATPAGFAPASLLSDGDREEQSLLLRFPQFKEILDSYYYPDPARGEILDRLRTLKASEESEDSSRARDEAELRDVFGAVLYTLAGVGDRIKLTGAGYMPPKFAFDLAGELGLKGYELSRGGESKMPAVAHFREALQKAGLLRKVKGDLLPTRAGKDGREEPLWLWNHLADRMLPNPQPDRTFSHDASLLALLVAATSDGELDLALVARLLTESGWRFGSETVARHHIAFDRDVWQVVLLWYMGAAENRGWFPSSIDHAACDLARAALIGMRPAG